MKIKISDYGAIKRASISLSSLNTFVGINGTGKTWTAYMLAAIFGPYGYKKYLKYYIENESNMKFRDLETSIQDVINNGNTKIDYSQFVRQHADEYFNNVASIVPKWMNEYLGTKLGDFDKCRIQLELKNEDIKKMIANNCNHLTRQFFS